MIHTAVAPGNLLFLNEGLERGLVTTGDAGRRQGFDSPLSFHATAVSEARAHPGFITCHLWGLSGQCWVMFMRKSMCDYFADALSRSSSRFPQYI